MKKSFTINKNNRAFILIYSTIFSFFLISLILLIQIILNSKIENFKFNKLSLEEYSNVEFLNSILLKELKLIENISQEENIEDISGFFDTSLNKNKIFNSEFEEKSSFGYSLMVENNNLNPKIYVEEMIRNSLENYINLNFKKTIYVDNEEYIIKANLEYDIKEEKNINNLPNGIIKRIWIEKND